ncbi:MAG: methionyl-tRNA formyltransferase [Saprospiraceae bacterium]|nr:methionyl-tRNA formyltransferase [Saprospiraceae bacterium]
MRIVFFGTPDFAVDSLEELAKHFEVVAVVTATDKVGGRNHKLLESAVKIWAVKNRCKLFQPKNLKNVHFHETLKALNPDLFVVVAFRMLPASLLSIPPLGTINLHGSLLPKYRGAAPIQRAILNGEQKTGLTTFFINKEIDTGDLLMQTELSIDPMDNFETLYQKMKKEGSLLLVKTIHSLQTNSIKPIQQHNEDASYAPKITSADLEIDWNRTSEEIYHQIRAFSPAPGARTIHNHQIFKITKAIPHQEVHSYRPGIWKIELPKMLKIYCKDGYLQILEIQAESKRKMNIADFLNGLQNFN